ncbi:Uncharacterised protein [uncultured archaeon]|nr:Uncharacterised protein [uncultured archaeon]
MIHKKIIIGLCALAALLLFLEIYFIFFYHNASFCNDGTAYNSCSNAKPYFCINGSLMEKASACGCSNSSEINSDSCVSKYQTEPKDITLSYTLRGEEKEIIFTAYSGLYSYLSAIPHYISANENPVLLDFKLRSINEEKQKELLMPLVIQIENAAKSKEDQARIAISIVQNIPFGSSNKTIQIGGIKTPYQRYPYEVLYNMSGICSEKSELLFFLLREIGYGTASLYYTAENHEAVGIKCPADRSVNNSGYCFVETTGPSIITDDQTEYIGIASELSSVPNVIEISDGISLGNNLYEYDDAKSLIKIREKAKKNDGVINYLQHIQFERLQKKYGLISFGFYKFT